MSYTKTTWVTGDTITAAKLNKMEDGIEAASGGSLANVKDGTGTGAVEEGVGTTASGDASHAEGYETTASEACSHAEGYGTTASGYASHAEGSSTTASGENSHTEGCGTTASEYFSHAEGYDTTASGNTSHAQNNGTIAQGMSQTAIGQYNVAQGTANFTETTDYAFIIGNGGDESNRSNAIAIRWDGAIVLADGTVLTVAQLAKVANLT